MNGCKQCPAFDKCTATYRGSACAALRWSYGIDTDPEILNTTDREKLIELLGEYARCDEFGVESCEKCQYRLEANCNVQLIADHLIANGVILLPCAEGETVYRIRKFCESTHGYKAFYEPTKEFGEDCRHYEPAEWELEERCKACDDIDKRSWCSQSVDILCEDCKGRLAIQKDIFKFSMLKSVFGTDLYNGEVPLEDTVFLTRVEAEEALQKWISQHEQPKEG